MWALYPSYHIYGEISVAECVVRPTFTKKFRSRFFGSIGTHSDQKTKKKEEIRPTLVATWGVISYLHLENVVLLQQPLHVLLREVVPDVVRDSRQAPHHLPGPVQQQRRQGHRVVVAALRRGTPQP